MGCNYDLEEERAIKWAEESGYRRILLQAPDGLKVCARRLAELLEGRGFEVLLSASHAWGGCDVGIHEMQRLGCDAIVHLGHHGPVRFNPPSNVLFIPARARVDATRVVERAAEVLAREGIERVGVLTNVQHVHQLPEIVGVLSRSGIKCFTASSRHPYMRAGLVTGCDVSAALQLMRRVEAFLVVGGGAFHALGVALATGQRTLAADPYTGSVSSVDREARRVLAIRLSHVASALEAGDAVIVASTKPGQWVGWERLERLKRLLKKKGIRAQTIVLDDVTREALEDCGPADLYINTACPRLATDDPHIFPGPVVNVRELLVVLERGLEGYKPHLSVI